MDRIWIAVAAFAGTAAVVADAAARHLLAAAPDRLDLAATGARYGLVHAAALLALALLLRGSVRGAARGWLAAAGWCFVAGQLLFCFVLYLLAAGLPPALAAAVPVGGTLFIAGWAALLVYALWPLRAA